MEGQKKQPISEATLERLSEGQRRGEIVPEARSHFGPLPVIQLKKPVRLNRIVKSAKR
jgi:hypothetical protein